MWLACHSEALLHGQGPDFISAESRRVTSAPTTLHVLVAMLGNILRARYRCGPRSPASPGEQAPAHADQPLQWLRGCGCLVILVGVKLWVSLQWRAVHLEAKIFGKVVVVKQNLRFKANVVWCCSWRFVVWGQASGAHSTGSGWRMPYHRHQSAQYRKHSLSPTWLRTAELCADSGRHRMVRRCLVLDIECLTEWRGSLRGSAFSPGASGGSGMAFASGPAGSASGPNKHSDRYLPNMTYHGSSYLKCTQVVVWCPKASRKCLAAGTRKVRNGQLQ